MDISPAARIPSQGTDDITEKTFSPVAPPRKRRKTTKDFSKIDVTWMSAAACLGKPTGWFYQRGRGNWQTTYAKALAVCNTCKVRKDCLNYALETLEPFGLWGGVPPGTREVLLGKRLSNLYPNHVKPPDPGIPKHNMHPSATEDRD